MAEAPVNVTVTAPDSVSKTDLETAKNDLRREMRLTVALGSAFGTTLSGILGTFIARDPGQAHETAMAALHALPF